MGTIYAKHVGKDQDGFERFSYSVDGFNFNKSLAINPELIKGCEIKKHDSLEIKSNLEKGKSEFYRYYHDLEKAVGGYLLYQFRGGYGIDENGYEIPFDFI